MQCLCEDGGTKPRLDRVGENKIYGAFEKLFQEALQVHIHVKGFALELYDKVKVAARSSLASGY